MDAKEAKDILSDMRDQHLCFLGNSEIKDEWQKKYLKEAWACDSGAKALAGLITGIKIDKGIITDIDTARLGGAENCQIENHGEN